MANYKGKRPGTRRIIIWWKGHRREWVIEGTKKEADLFEAKKKLELRVQEPTERRVDARFSQLCEEYAVHAERHLKKTTWRSRTSQLASLIEFFGQKKVSELSAGLVDAYKRQRTADKLLNVSINNELRVMRAVLNWGKELGHDIPPLKWRRLPPQGAPRPKAFTSDEISLLLSKCRVHSPTMLPLLIFLVNTGCRKGEAIAAEWSWMDFEAGLIRIPSNEHWQPKNGKPREIPMADAVRAVLSGPRMHPRWVFPTQSGTHVAGSEPRSWQRRLEFPRESWQRVMKAANLTGGPHQLRHTYASHFLQKVPEMKLLAAVLGHSTTRVTELYSHLLPGHLERARNAVNLSPETTAVAVGRATGTHKKQ